MSLDEIREQNKQHVTACALKLFLERGIVATKVSDIARAAALTERSVFRYYPTKADIIQAAAYSYWQSAQTSAFEAHSLREYDAKTGIEQIREMLWLYCDYFLKHPGGARFTVEAETALFNAGETRGDIHRPPDPYESSDRVLVRAIKKGLVDGTVDPACNPRELYYNAYDAILGVLQRIARDATKPEGLDDEQRMRSLCTIFVDRFAGNRA